MGKGFDFYLHIVQLVIRYPSLTINNSTSRSIVWLHFSILIFLNTN